MLVFTNSQEILTISEKKNLRLNLSDCICVLLLTTQKAMNLNLTKLSRNTSHFS